MDANASLIPDRDAFWDVIEQYGATYFCGHEHIYNVSRPRGGAYQVIVGAGGSPFEAKATDTTVDPATDRDYSWATVRLQRNGSAHVHTYGFGADFGATRMLQHFYLP